jgi:hypothetical protein
MKRLLVAAALAFCGLASLMASATEAA